MTTYIQNVPSWALPLLFAAGVIGIISVVSTAQAANTRSADFENSGGENQYLSVSDEDQRLNCGDCLDVTSDLTLEAWVKLESQPSVGEAYAIVSKTAGDINDGGYELVYQNTAVQELILATSADGNVGASCRVQQTLANNTWYHVAAIYDASARGCEIFVNGSSIGTGGNLFASIRNTGASFKIGARGNTPALFFDGLIDEVRVWNDVRTTTEIADNFQTELSGTEPNLQGYWKLDEASGQRADAAKGNALNGINTVGSAADMPFDGTLPLITSLEASSITNTTATITWTTDVLSDSTVRYGTTTPVEDSNPLLQEGDGALVTSHGIPLFGLELRTVYYFRVFSTDGVEGTGTGNQQSFTTSAPVGDFSAEFEKDSSEYLSIDDFHQQFNCGSCLDITSDLTLEAWVKLKSQPVLVLDEVYTIASKSDGNVNDAGYEFLYRDTAVGTNLRFVVSPDGNTSLPCDLPQTLNIDVWHHVAVTYDASVGSCEMFVDGSSIGTGSGLFTSIHDSGASFKIGARGKPAQSFFDGLIDEVRVWDDIRTPTEIADSFQTELLGTEANLQGYWKLNEAGGIRFDTTVNGNDLIENNTVGSSVDVPFGGDEIPPIILNPQAISVTATTATITWTTDELADSKVTYGTTTPVLNSDPLLEEINPATTSDHGIVLSNLEAGTTYYYVAVSVDESGNSATSSEQSFTTLVLPVLKVDKTVDESHSSADSGVTLQTDDELVLVLEANKTYIIDGSIFAESPAPQPDIKIAFEAPPGAEIDLGYIAAAEMTHRRSDLLESSGVAGGKINLNANERVVIQVGGRVKMGPTQGTLTLLWAQNTAKADPTTVKAGSYLRADEI